MTLDPKIIEGKKPLTGFDVDEAQDFIGEEGFFSNRVGDFEALYHTRQGTLKETVVSIEDFPFLAGDNTYRYFLPRKWVMDIEPKPEPEWKPYDIKSWEKHYDIGDAVEYRRKETFDKEHENVRLVAYLGHADYVNSGKTLILLGDSWCTFEELFENYEIHDYRYNNNHRVEWRRFGYRE